MTVAILKNVTEPTYELLLFFDTKRQQLDTNQTPFSTLYDASPPKYRMILHLICTLIESFINIE